jgi:hypothetical protein
LFALLALFALFAFPALIYINFFFEILQHRFVKQHQISHIKAGETAGNCCPVRLFQINFYLCRLDC